MGAIAHGQKLKDIRRTGDLAEQGNPRGSFWALETTEMEPLDKMDSVLMKEGGTPMRFRWSQPNSSGLF